MNNFKSDEVPYFGTIGKTNITTVEFKPIKNDHSTITGRRESHGFDIFKLCPDNMIILDCRTAPDEKIMDFILKYTDPGSVTKFAGNDKKQNDYLRHYCDLAKLHKYTVSTVKELLIK